MAEISAQMVKELREKTGAGMMDCKKALSETAGDFEKAEDWLRKKGISKAASKGSRVAAEGLIGLEQGDTAWACVEVNSETDFVARNPDFVELTRGMAAHVAKHAPKSLENLLEQAWTDGKSVKDFLTSKIATIGENIAVRRFERYAVAPTVALGSYVHGDNRKASMVELTLGTPAAAGSDDARALARELAMQVTAAWPKYVSRESVPADALEKEKDIFREELKAAKKPEAIWEKILTGKIEKFYEGVCLVDQLWIKEDKKKIRDLVAELAKKLGTDVTVTRMVRFEVGEGVEKKKEDLAAEVAKTLGQA